MSTVQELLERYATRENCSRYNSAAEQVKLLEFYFLARQLTPNLSFELFLSLFESIADYDDANLKIPADAIKELLPMTQNVATRNNLRKWSAKERVEYLTLYVDMVREAETAQQPVPMTLQEFLRCQPMISAFLNGDFSDKPQIKKKTKKEKTSDDVPFQPTSVTPVLNTSVPVPFEGVRVVYTEPSSRQHRGTVVASDPVTNTVAFKADSGELFTSLLGTSLQQVHDQVRRGYCDENGNPLPVAAAGQIKISKVDFDVISRLSAIGHQSNIVGVGENLYFYKCDLTATIRAVVAVVNTAPLYIDATLYDVTNPANPVALFEVQPRDNILGTYEFVHNNSRYVVDVVTH